MISNSIRAAGAFVIAAVATAGFAQAAPRDPAATAATIGASGARQSGAQDSANDRRRYCIDGPSTGTMLSTRRCKTRAEWARVGIQIPSQN
jgi:hypothetical protein